jgi:hypothetical protein
MAINENGYDLDATQNEKYKFVMQIASGKINSTLKNLLSTVHLLFSI